MGIFSSDKADDVQTITRVITVALQGYNKQSLAGDFDNDIEVEFGSQLESSINCIQETGTEILREHFEKPTAIDRIAVLLVLSNSFPVFSFRKQGKPYFNIPGRKLFLSRFTCLYVHIGMAVFPWTDDGGNTLVLAWKKFPDDEFRQQFLTFLAWTPGAKVTSQPAGASQKADTLKTLAQLSLGCSMMLRYCIESQIVTPNQLH